MKSISTNRSVTRFVIFFIDNYSGRSACLVPGIDISSLSYTHWYQWKIFVFLPLPLKSRVASNRGLPIVPTQHNPHQFLLISINGSLRETETSVIYKREKMELYKITLLSDPTTLTTSFQKHVTIRPHISVDTDLCHRDTDKFAQQRHYASMALA